ncbi:MAG: amidohydrolase family protein, partial [Rhodobacteraceae bacterium]|nr:amidohydrolase family protein [Paracoccaceae bacterium]
GRGVRAALLRGRRRRGGVDRHPPALRRAALGGAQVLGRDDCGALAPGKRADLAIWDVTGLEAAGAWDPVAALVLCGPLPVRDLIVEGRKVVSGGRLCTVEPERLAAEAGAAVARLMA